MLIAFVVSGLGLGGFVVLWVVLGTPRGAAGGVLWTSRSLSIAAAFAVIGALGFWVPWALDDFDLTFPLHGTDAPPFSCSSA